MRLTDWIETDGGSGQGDHQGRPCSTEIVTRTDSRASLLGEKPALYIPMHPTSNTERQSSIVDSGGDRQIQSASPIKEPTASMNLANRAHTPPSACQTSPVGPVPNRTKPNRIERPEHETRRHSFPEHRDAEPHSELPNRPKIFPHADKTSAKLTQIAPPESHDLPQNTASPHF